MAFKFRNKNPVQNAKHFNQFESDMEKQGNNSQTVLPKLTNSQLNKLTKVYPSWLKDNSSLKQLPGIYHGVLGQVQLQPIIGSDNKLSLSDREQFFSISRQHQADYMNKFTDTKRVQQLLSTSQLSNDTLATIWAHVNKTFPGKLTNREVCLALALIALFQRLEANQNGMQLKDKSKQDPFIEIKNEKKPPVPKLYSAQSNHLPFKKTNLTSSRSMTNELTSTGLLIDLQDEPTKSLISLNKDSDDNFHKTDHVVTKLSHLVSLIDMDGDRFERNILRLTNVWLKFLTALKGVFKRSFDVLNVEHSRKSAIEALKSTEGKLFSKQLCLCYPLAHNIKFKIDELSKFKLSNAIIPDEQNNNSIFSKNYIEQIDDLMTSINEYWAVIINLFHESGQTKFIELIMDGLNYKTKTVASTTIDELANELDLSKSKSDVCCICLTKVHLINCEPSNSKEEFADEDIEFFTEVDLISLDEHYFYHARCANFWLNYVDPDELPFHKQDSPVNNIILSPGIVQ